MIYFADRYFKTKAVASIDSPRGLVYTADKLSTDIKTGTSVLELTLEKSHPSINLIKVGDYVFAPNQQGEHIVLEIMEIFESHGQKNLIAEDAGLELLNEETGPIKDKGTLKEWIKMFLGEKSDWKIGIDETDGRSLSLEWEGTNTLTKRLVELARRFDCEISYSFKFRNNDLVAKLINFQKKRGKESGRRLEFGRELKDVTRHVSITELCTAVRAIGQPHTETVKTEKTVTVPGKPAPKSVSTRPEDNPQRKKFVGWMQAKVGHSWYSQSQRCGPNSFDCSSAVYYAALHAGLIDRQGWPATTETLFNWKGKYLDEINRNDVKFGDIFVCGVQGQSLYNSGHTGVILDKNRIIHCTTGNGRSGVMVTPWAGWTFSPMRFFRWKRINDKPQPKPQPSAPAKYWTSGNLVDHDLGWKLPGLTAQQLNNWVRATSPGSPFNGQGQVFLDAQAKSGLDARYILAHAALESAWGTSNYGRNHHNYFGIGAFDNNPDNAKNYSNPGLATGIIEGAKWIAKNYYNGQWKQRTLRKMRWNNNVHQYATAPNWDTAIAKIMKGSERYTRPGSAGQGGSAPTTKTEIVSEQVEKPTNLIGFEYDDGTYFVDKATGILYDKVNGPLWSRYHTSGDKEGYILRTYDSQAKTQKALFDEAKRFLEQHNTPKVSYEVKLDYLPDSVEIGDTVRIIDHDYNPPLYIDARLVETSWSKTDPYNRKAVFANFEEKKSGIEQKLIDLQSQIDKNAWRFDNQPYDMTISSTSGNLLKDDVRETDLVAVVKRAGIDQTAYIDGFLWQRVTDYKSIESTSDEAWNKSHEDANEAYLHVTPEDLEIEATFTCSAMVNGVAVAVASYTVKNLAVKVFTGDTQPVGMKYGDIWIKSDGSRLIYTKNDSGALEWIPQVTKRDLEAIEKMPGPAGAPGKDGKDGLPGKDGRDGKPGADGKSAYIHFAYADSADGRTGFTLTATPGKKYIGVLADDKQADSTEPSAYEWSLFKGQDGAQGVPGKAGADGRTPYIHTAWSGTITDFEGFSTTDSTDREYMGTCVDYTKADPTDPTKYSWVKVKGEDGGQGPRGEKGEPGIAGKDGHTLTAYVYNECDFKNSYLTGNGRQTLYVYYDGRQLKDDEYTCEQWYRTDGGEWIKDKSTEKFATWWNGEKRNEKVLETWFRAHYKGMTVDVVGKLVNVNDGAPGKPLRRNLVRQTVNYIGWIDDYVTHTVENGVISAKSISEDPNKFWPRIHAPWINVEKDKVYTLSFYAKAEKDYSMQVQFSEMNAKNMVFFQSADVKKDWGKHVFTFTAKNTSSNDTYLQFYCRYRIWLKHIKLEEGDTATDWIPAPEDLEDAIASKADGSALADLASKQQATETRLQLYPDPEELKKTTLELAKQQGYLNALKVAIESDKLSLLDRMAIIEANVGKGKLSLQAIETYLNFGEEGVIIGKGDNPIKMVLANDRLEILDGKRVALTISNNSVSVPNLAVSGALEFGNHLAVKQGRDHTIIKPRGVS